MDKNEFLSRIQAIGSCEDESQRRELLTQLQESAEQDYDERDTLRQTNEQLTTDNETLRSANMKLFLRIGDHKGTEQPGGMEEKQKREFKDLFNEKGELK